MASLSPQFQVTPASYSTDPLALHAAAPDRYPFLLESTARGTTQGRYDILFGFPQDYLRHGPGDSFLTAFDAAWASAHPSSGSAPANLPFTGGWFLLLAYELAGEIEPTLRLPDAAGMPTGLAVRIPVALVRDHQKEQAWVVAEPGFAAEAAALQEDLRHCSALSTVNHRLLKAPMKEPDPREYLRAVALARRHIEAGDIFQANLSREWHGRLTDNAGPAEIYRRLRASNPGPFAGLAVLDDLAVISSSPERLVTIRDGRVETRPIAGTRPRSGKPEDDAPGREELRDHPKEQAEHVMLIDLERNDLGRVCEAGSVHVDEFMVVESYAHVHHIVSNVSGVVRAGTRPGEILRAVFPGGTITGCPKVRCMELIAQLEGRPRGFYTGSMGYLNHDGSGDANILIRTIVSQGRDIRLAAGSGIVADSDPERELEETRAKAKGMLLALQ